MVESDDEFTELCSKLLKRVKKSQPPEGQSIPKASTATRRKLRRIKSTEPKSQTSNGGGKEAEQVLRAGHGTEKPSDSDGTESSGAVQSYPSHGHTETDGSRTEGQVQMARPMDQPSVKDIIMERMQQFKRASPNRMKLDSTEVSGSYEASEALHTDGALALALQMDIKEQPVSLEDEGLFFCQLCQKDLTAMNSSLREQHVNRCLDQDESLGGISAAPSVPSCPLCGKPFNTQKSRASHLKRCAAQLEVPAQTLLQAVQRQAVETAPPRAACVKRKGVPKQKQPSKKRKTTQIGAEQDDLLVAMALSRSMQEEKTQPNPVCTRPLREIPPPEKKSRRKQKEKATPLLLVQAPEEALQKLQKRMSMLLTEEPEERTIMALPLSCFWSMELEQRDTWSMRGGTSCVLWESSNMMENRDALSYYTAELNPPITPWKPLSKLLSSQPLVATANVTPGNSQKQVPADTDLHSVNSEDRNPPSDSQKALLDLAELAGEGMTLTQWNCAASSATEWTGQESPVGIAPTGFIPQQEDQNNKQSHAPNTAPLVTLAADFMELVNNPHLSDAQLQTDCGEVLNAHMLVIYARCPLLVEAVHTEGFWVQEASAGRVRRLLLNDVSAEAALSFLRFLYSANTAIPSHCLTHVCELARRFGVNSLIDTCEQLVGERQDSEALVTTQEDGDNGGERAETFQELLKSMWLDEGEDLFTDQEAEGLPEEERLDDGGVGEGELEEIYEFAATQRKMPVEQDKEGGSRSEHDDYEAEHGGKESEDSSPEARNHILGWKEQMIDVANPHSTDWHMETPVTDTTPLQASPVPKAGEGTPFRKSPDRLTSNSLESSPVFPSLASPGWLKTQPSRPCSVFPIQSPPKFSAPAAFTACRLFSKDCSKHSQSPLASPENSTSPVAHAVSLISPNTYEDPEGDLFAQHNHSSLDDSFDRMFSETCGEYVEPSGICESRSHVSPTNLQDQVPMLTSSPSANPSPALPVLGSSANIQPQTNSFLESSSYGHGKSPPSSLKDPNDTAPSQNSSNKAASSPKVSFQDSDIILILSSDEETDSSTQATVPNVKGQNNKTVMSKSKESPISFSMRKCSENLSHLEMSSSSETSWLVPATPLPSLTESRVSQLQTSRLPRSPQTSRQTSHLSRSPQSSPQIPCFTQSPQRSLVTSHLSRSPQKSPVTSRCPRTPETSPVASRFPQSPETSPVTSRFHRSPQTSAVTSCYPRSPQTSPVSSYYPRSPQTSPVTSRNPRSPVTSPVTSHFPRSPHTSLQTSQLSQSPLTSQQTSHFPQSLPTSKTCKQNISHSSFVNPSQTSLGSLPLLFPKSPKTTVSLNQSLYSNITEKQEKRQYIRSSTASKVTSSPPTSVASSTVFEVGDSEDEGPVPEPQANTTDCSFQMDYDEPPIHIEDVWSNMQETPTRPHSSPEGTTPSHHHQTPTKRPGIQSRTILLNGDTEAASSLESPPTSRSNQLSFLNSKLWDEWEDEEPELPAVLPLSQRMNKVPVVQKELRTPVTILRRRELAPKVPITPLPHYSDMDTPVLKKELNRFGVRALPKKQMVLKLKEIFSYTHQVMSSDSEDDVPTSQPPQRVHSSVAPTEPQPVPRKPRHGATTEAPSNPKRGKKTTSVCAAQETDTGDDQPLTASQESTTSSVAASDTSSLSHSSNANEFETAFADEEDDEPVAASQVASKEALTTEAVRRFIESRPDLHKRILLYQPLDLAAVHSELKQNGIKLAAGKLLDFLDAHCVTFTTATARKEKKSHGRRKAGKRH
ncbi:structure-specific endonuclease subunit SLX4 isoform X2 [Pseudophryne corroboree]|uniref:structure-specific endonuclease subunit SLX4 isoform X2 n=1 Tax=Pseudophryne corroboree TaxID=495146 RepID=UPI0030814B45